MSRPARVRPRCPPPRRGRPPRRAPPRTAPPQPATPASPRQVSLTKGPGPEASARQGHAAGAVGDAAGRVALPGGRLRTRTHRGRLPDVREPSNVAAPESTPGEDANGTSGREGRDCYGRRAPEGHWTCDRGRAGDRRRRRGGDGHGPRPRVLSRGRKAGRLEGRREHRPAGPRAWAPGADLGRRREPSGGGPGSRRPGP